MKKPKKAKTIRLGLAGYVRLLAILRATPLSAVELQAASGIGHNTANRFLASMYALKLVHIAGWRTESGTPTQPRFSGFPGTDVPPPTRRPNGRPIDGVNMLSPVTPASELVAFACLLRALELPATRAELAQATGMNDQTIRVALKAMMTERVARIALWTPRPNAQGGAPVPNFALGSGPNAPRPRPMPAAELRRQYVESVQQRKALKPLASLLTAWRNPTPEHA